MCLVASAIHSNEVCNNEELQALALSQVPFNQVFGKMSSFNLNWVTQFIAWFKKSYKVGSENSGDTNGTLTDNLSYGIGNLTASHERNIVLICLITLRALGLETRLVLSLQPEPSSTPFCLRFQVDKCQTKGSHVDPSFVALMLHMRKLLPE